MVFYSKAVSIKSSYTLEDLQNVKRRKDLIRLANEKGINIKKTIRNLRYEEELRLLQAELVDLQQFVAKNKLRVAVLFEGRDAAGKGGSIKRFTEHLNPRSMRVVALSKPTEVEKGQWFFRRYIKELPNPGEIVFFDRSWYNRAVVEPVMGFCSDAEYRQFMVQVPGFEHMLYEDGVVLIKFWFSISKEEQKRRFESRMNNPLKKWKFSEVDMEGQRLWDSYTHYKEQMFSRTHSNFSPWIIVKTNNKRIARLESIRHVLSQFQYSSSTDSKRVSTLPDPNVIMRYYRSVEQIDI